MRRLSAICAFVGLGLVAACGSDEPLDDPEASVPREARHLIAGRTDIVVIECSGEDEFAEDILDSAYQAVDFIAFPQSACTIEFVDGSVGDLFLMRGQWYGYERDGSRPLEPQGPSGQ